MTTRMFLAALVIANLPDLDIIPAVLIKGHFQDLHRALGHNIFSLGIWTALGAYLLRWAEFGNGFPRPKISRRHWLLAALLASSHVLLDAVGHFSTTGFRPTVPIFWPLSQWTMSLPFRVFSMMDTGFHPPHVQLRLSNLDFWGEVLYCEVAPSLFLFVAWLVLMEVYDWLRANLPRGKHKKRAVPQP